jgi:hypothetical protein
MTTLALILAVVLLAMACTALFLALRRARRRNAPPATRTFSTVEELRAVGELSVFKAVTKEIVTARDHAFGPSGERWFGWLLSSKKMAVIFEFDLDFTYDLRSPLFRIEPLSAPASYRFHMPPCRHETRIRNITFYDEQAGRLLPDLLPDLVNRLLGGGFTEEDRNRLMDEARLRADSLADALATRLSSEVQSSARQTLTLLAKSFGAASVEFAFPAPTAASPSAQSAQLPA